ncbi:TlyA family RNA methyltransferase [Oceanirhabdus sp. W0125-5]|uniref:TlyA family RNA methyltransferase n=1 Tax=Oceanirhabdus sp. W0125-5 TaxID=2999116 RepID=UPI0022F2B519|nr:TlyA family RNA methyltransferase [Oceanirhabdus sp. W0125-5]WBW95320.1 TlyA family RNA methyltransferase [Oceanirhabdus sp. W0125-5]
METERLDVLLYKKGMFSSRERAQEHIKKGDIQVDGKIVTKTGKKVLVDSDIQFTGRKIPYVSRGGLKLEKAIDEYNIDLKDLICMDIGASTGGFTDCMIQNGAHKVYSIDVGTDQLHEKLKGHPQIISMENCNIRDLTQEQVEDNIDFISIDVSFISLSKILSKANSFLKDNGRICALIKPQFECGRKYLNKKGVVKDKKEHKRVINEILSLFKDENIGNVKLSYSPIKGPNGNIEYLIYGEKSIVEYNDIQVENIVNDAFLTLK